MSNDLRLQAKETLIESNTVLEMLQRLQVLHIADVLAEEGIVLFGETERVLQSCTDGQRLPRPKGKHYDPDNFSSDLREANKKAGLEWTCLDFRHTFGSHLAMKGESLYKISALMGNSPEICRRHYAALIPEAMADSVEFTPEKNQAPKRNIRLASGI